MIEHEANRFSVMCFHYLSIAFQVAARLIVVCNPTKKVPGQSSNALCVCLLELLQLAWKRLSPFMAGSSCDRTSTWKQSDTHSTMLLYLASAPKIMLLSNDSRVDFAPLPLFKAGTLCGQNN